MVDKKAIITVLSVLAGFVTVIIVLRGFDGSPPTVTFSTPFDVAGAKTALRLHVEDMRTGLKYVSVAIEQGEERYVIAVQQFEGPRWLTLWKGGPEKQFDLDLIPYSDREIPRKEGDATLIITAEDYSWRHLSGGNRQAIVHEFRTKFRAPQLERLSSRHVINQGGAELVRYRVSDDAVRHGVEIAKRFFPGYSILGSGDHFAMLAFPFTETENIPIFIVARDEAENQSKIPVPYDLVKKTWRQRKINIDDRFIQRTVHPLIAQSSEIDETGNPLSDFLAANTTLRNITNQRLAEIAKDTRPQRLWSGTFLQMSNSQVQALFADRRDYYYNGEKVDTKDHLGYDLAATKNYPVEAGNTGVVIFAEDLGLYGNSVIIDHGYGLQSLYGHLASFAVMVDEEIEKGQVVGYTGSTGMAGGDHLHFSMLLHGQQINPIEWWDRQWIRLHIEDRL
tara:strand:+ start:784 stop:2133 length:1350 start_codon:yes stop_codon:yes gene_type:complete